MRNTLVVVLVAVFLLTSKTNQARADFLLTVEVTLDRLTGLDALGLDGAVFTLQATFDESSPYEDRFGFPSILAESSQATIQGSVVDGNYSLDSDIAFYPSFSGVYSDPAGLNDISITIGSETISFGFETVTTASGANSMIGGIPELADFGPTAVLFTQISSSNFEVLGDSTYDFSASSVTISQIPEPATTCLIVSMALATLVKRRR